MRKTIRLAALAPAMLLFLSGCSLRFDPPSPAEAREFLDRHREDIDLVTAYLLELDADYAFISKSLLKNPGKVFYAFETHDISSKEVVAAVRRLWRAGCTVMKKDDQNDNHTLSFMLWSRTMGSVDCGIAFVIGGEGTPKTAFQTMHEEIGDGWFYYYDDYEAYRSHPSQYADDQPLYGP